MLKMIRCDKFMENGCVRPPIMFTPGLNTVLGSESGSNSIGKSTFLMILDFVFGGDDYVLKSTDVQEAIKVHTIEFMFEFDGESFYYSRSTGDHTVVNICDQDFNVIKTISNDRYMEILAEKYGMVLPGLTFRNAVARFFRVYGRETLDENHPLKSATRETDKAGIEGLLKLCDKYAAVAEFSKGVERARDEAATIKKAAKYRYIAAVPNKTAYKENQRRIEELLLEAQELEEQSSQGLLDMDSMQAAHLAELKHQLSNFRRQRTRLISQKKSIEADRDFTKHSFQRDYDALMQFFPECNLERLESIEKFHRSLFGVLKKEFRENADSIQAMIDLATQQITLLEEQIAGIGNTPNVSEAILARYASVQKELQLLQEANANYEKTEELKARTKTLTQKLDALILEVILRSSVSFDDPCADPAHGTVAVAFRNSGFQLGKSLLTLVLLQKGIEGDGAGMEHHLRILCADEETGGIHGSRIEERKDFRHTLFQADIGIRFAHGINAENDMKPGSGGQISLEFHMVTAVVDEITIKNLTVKGTITTSTKFAGGLVAVAIGDCVTDSCVSDVTIVSAVSGDGTHGGLVAHFQGTGELIVTNCAFRGRIEGASSTCCAGMVGWADGVVRFKNCYVAGTLAVDNTTDSDTFETWSGGR